jgi:hypothetical protein
LRGIPILSATQMVKFQLDESGVVLDSATFVVLGDPPPESPKPRQFVFDRPFLVLLQERHATAPYLALWIANSELLVPFDPAYSE